MMTKQSSFTLCLMLLAVATMLCTMNTISVEAGRGGYNSVNPDGRGAYNSVNPNGRGGYNSVNPDGRSGYNSVNPDGRSGYNSVPTNGGGNP
uniref:Uncharacterized protein n=1 Tax=Leersia perrieri TaxID=77586 RepID=A0A0D9VBL0_9ORYZ